MVCGHDICTIFYNRIRIASSHEFPNFEDPTQRTLVSARSMELDFVKSRHDDCSLPNKGSIAVKMLVSPNLRMERIFVIVLQTMVYFILKDLKLGLKEK